MSFIYRRNLGLSATSKNCFFVSLPLKGFVTENWVSARGFIYRNVSVLYQEESKIVLHCVIVLKENLSQLFYSTIKIILFVVHRNILELSLTLSLENVWKFIGDFADNLLIASRFCGLFAKDSSEDFHEVECAMLMFGVVSVAQDATT